MKRQKQMKEGTTWPASRPLAAKTGAPPWFIDSCWFVYLLVASLCQDERAPRLSLAN